MARRSSSSCRRACIFIPMWRKAARSAAASLCLLCRKPEADPEHARRAEVDRSGLVARHDLLVEQIFPARDQRDALAERHFGKRVDSERIAQGVGLQVILILLADI